jgi:hypothetical protein
VQANPDRAYDLLSNSELALSDLEIASPAARSYSPSGLKKPKGRFFMHRPSLEKLSRFMMSAVACGVLAAGIPAIAQSNADSTSDAEHCSDRTITGGFGYSSDGFVIPAPGVTLPFRSVGTTHFDGKGDFSFVEHTVVNGVSQESGWTHSTGTYSVNADCTGTFTINTPDSPVPIQGSFVVVKGGREILGEGNTNAISTHWLRLGHGERDRD